MNKSEQFRRDAHQLISECDALIVIAIDRMVSDTDRMKRAMELLSSVQFHHLADLAMKLKLDDLAAGVRAISLAAENIAMSSTFLEDGKAAQRSLFDLIPKLFSPLFANCMLKMAEVRLKLEKQADALNVPRPEDQAAIDYMREHPGQSQKVVARAIRVHAPTFTKHNWPRLCERHGCYTGKSGRGCYPPPDPRSTR